MEVKESKQPLTQHDLSPTKVRGEVANGCEVPNKLTSRHSLPKSRETAIFSKCRREGHFAQGCAARTSQNRRTINPQL